jgi:hypothetical protein
MPLTSRLAFYKPVERLTANCKIPCDPPEGFARANEYVKQNAPLEVFKVFKHVASVHFLYAPVGKLDLLALEDLSFLS